MRVVLRPMLALVALFFGVGAAAVSAQGPKSHPLGPKYPPLSEYMMTRKAEVSLARSAAPDHISAHAAVEILTASGYQVAVRGDNGFVCLVMRGWTAPTYTPAPLRNLVYDSKLRAPICFDPVASRTVLPYYELRTKLGMQGKDPDALRAAWRRRTHAGNCRRGMGCPLPTLVGQPEPRPRDRRVAPAHDDLRALLY